MFASSINPDLPYYTTPRRPRLFPAVPAYPVTNHNRGGACHAAGCRQRGTKRKIAGGRGAGGYVGDAVRHHPSAVPPGVRRDRHPQRLLCGVGGDGGDGAAQNRLPDL